MFDDYLNLTYAESNVLQKIADKYKMDCWFYIDEHGIIKDLESPEDNYSQKEMLFQMLEGMENVEDKTRGNIVIGAYEFCNLSVAEINVFENVFKSRIEKLGEQVYSDFLVLKDNYKFEAGYDFSREGFNAVTLSSPYTRPGCSADVSSSLTYDNNKGVFIYHQSSRDSVRGTGRFDKNYSISPEELEKSIVKLINNREKDGAER